MSHAVGIDLGTTNSVVAFLESGKVTVIANSEGAKTTPSVVLAPDNDSEPLVGDMARRQSLIHPEQVIRSVKRFIGRRFDELSEEDLQCPYRIAPGPDGQTLIDVGGRLLSPEEISALILRKMILTAEDFLGEDITEAVVTVPAYFNDSQRKATKKAGELAGVKVLRIINEPTAAALAYGLRSGKSERVAVFDFGGGTFDISILEIDDDVFEVKSTNGDTHLGGDNIDQLVYDHLVERIRETTGLDPTLNVESRQRILDAAEKAKCELSTLPETLVSLPFIVSDAQGPRHFNSALTRAEFEALIAPVLERLGPPCRRALLDARLNPDDLSTVLLVGGSTRIPAVRALTEKIFGRPPSHTVHPDEAVAQGAAIQSGVLTGALQEVLLLDITPLSLGVELQGGIFSPLIPRNSTIPTSAMKTFTTVRDNQSNVRIHVLQGERRQARENRTLAHFRLEGIEPAPREIPEIAVTFSIDANGILNVTAQDLSSGAIKVVSVESYAQDAATSETDTVVRDAEAHLDSDRQFVMLARARIRCARYLDMAREYLSHEERRMTEAEAKLFRERMFRLDMALAGEDVLAIDSAENDLRELSNQFDGLLFVENQPH